MSVYYVYDVLSPMTHPVPARAGDGLVVQPGHPTHPISVVRQHRDGWRVVEVGPPNYGALLVKVDEGVIAQRYPSSSALSEHLGQRSA